MSENFINMFYSDPPASLSGAGHGAFCLCNPGPGIPGCPICSPQNWARMDQTPDDGTMHWTTWRLKEGFQSRWATRTTTKLDTDVLEPFVNLRPPVGESLPIPVKPKPTRKIRYLDDIPDMQKEKA